MRFTRHILATLVAGALSLATLSACTSTESATSQLEPVTTVSALYTKLTAGEKYKEISGKEASSAVEKTLEKLPADTKETNPFNTSLHLFFNFDIEIRDPLEYEEDSGTKFNIDANLTIDANTQLGHISLEKQDPKEIDNIHFPFTADVWLSRNNDSSIQMYAQSHDKIRTTRVEAKDVRTTVPGFGLLLLTKQQIFNQPEKVHVFESKDSYILTGASSKDFILSFMDDPLESMNSVTTVAEVKVSKKTFEIQAMHVRSHLTSDDDEEFIFTTYVEKKPDITPLEELPFDPSTAVEKPGPQ
ncbi:hypothetical protein R6G85_03380 [Actinotignum urinale]|uniref:Lipoprotein n=1 Tax=Actinotignum urinale TaxID=190146 RepID=A0ABU5G8Y9_9ACTO|nr:hypothetical protein [Actinotignum urinale]MDY5129760.1 hypothetical protein [Actinotignum urinale]MDY5133785.1 hypothetical protein [Actinotignum urinale]MDY5151532.1 hypothetical protein [Actinotignum urinale]MDY5161113.1 hypothetical protein [Actinotignum urinale]WIK59461.1 hypothetical protein CJ184_002090 [Actinotignum urinale]